MIRIIEYIHQRGFIHRDIKPDNFCVGIPASGIPKNLLRNHYIYKKYLSKGLE